MNERILYTYFRSSSAYRVRIALNLLQLDYRGIAVHLLNDGGQQHSAAYRSLNPAQLVPTYVEHEDEGRVVLTQSLAIMEYLDEVYGGQRLPNGQRRAYLLPKEDKSNPKELSNSRYARSYVRALSQTIASEIAPLNNLRVLQYLEKTLGLASESKTKWYTHWVEQGLYTLEALVNRAPRCEKDTFCYGLTPSMADCCLIPQLFNARRFDVELSPYPTLLAIEARCQALPAFAKAAPSAQIDAS